MGFEAFKYLWLKKDDYDIVIMDLPTKKNFKQFRPYLKKAGVEIIEKPGIMQGRGLKVIWGDATIYDNVKLAVEGIDWCLCPMALISPAADHDPQLAKAVNTKAIQHLVKAIESEPNGAEHVNLICVGTVAATGDRLPPIYVGRVGDPLKPSIFDYYACTKIAGERIVLESNIKHWAILRQTFILIPNPFKLKDPIMFHQPINSFMENITSQDAGRGLVNCLDIKDDSDFWRRVYNMSGGPACRITYLEFLRDMYALIGLDYKNVFERKWFAIRNFHMQFFEDSWVLNQYLHHWRDSMETYYARVKKAMPLGLKIVSWSCKHSKMFRKAVEKRVYKEMKKLASCPDGTLGWIKNNNQMRITAFYKDLETYNSIPNWNSDLPTLNHDQDYKRLDHGYDESKETLQLEDLKGAAKFRGGICLSKIWSGNMYETLRWKCAFGHEFDAKPYTVIKAGHWCPKCAPPPWNYDAIARKVPFFKQVWETNHDPDENNFYPEDCYLDIVGHLKK